MKNTSITRRLTVGLGLIAFFFVLQIAYTWWAQERVRRDVVESVLQNTRAAASLSDLGILAQQIRRYEKEYFVYVDNAERRNAYEKEWSETSAKIGGALAKMRQNADGAFVETDVKQFDRWQAAADFYGAEMKRIFSDVTSQAGLVAASRITPVATTPAPASAAAVPTPPAAVMYSSGQVNEMIKAGKDRFSGELIKGVAQMQAEKTKATLALADVANAGFRTLLLALAASGVVGILIALFLAWRLPRAILEPVKAMTAAVEKISLGQAKAPMSAVGVREFQGLAGAIERMRVAQETLVTRMRARAAVLTPTA